MDPTSETDLFAWKDPSAPLGPFDAKAATIIGDYVYTSPNQSVIWSPAPTGEIYIRSDFRFGPHDPTLWPQSYVADYPHLGAIPTKPMDPDAPLSFMWWNPTRGDFINASGGAVDGIGLLSRARYSRFEEMKKELDSRIKNYYTNNPTHKLLNLLERDMHNILTRLGSLRTTFDPMVFGVTELQRCYLETLGLLDYLEIYKPRQFGFVPRASTVGECMGVITNKPNIVQEFFDAGMPVWFCQPKVPGVFPHNVLDVVDPFEHANFLCVNKPDAPFPVIYDGPLDTCKRHDALHRFSRSMLVLKDPYADKLSSTQASTSKASMSRASSQASTSITVRGPHPWKHQPAQSTDRDKFASLRSPFAPFPIPAWAAALAAVDRSVCVEFPNTVYAFPDPGLLVSPAKDERKARFIETWVRSRDAWISRIAQEGSLAMKAQHWREFLLTDLSSVSELTGESTKSGKRRQHVRGILKEKLSFDPAVAPRCTVGELFFWQGRGYPPGDLPPENVVRQILWELYELNFSQEFVSLDRRACTKLDMRNTEVLYNRQTLISKCFVSNSVNYAPLPNTNCGLAAENIRDRLPYIRRMVHIMGSWKGTKPAAFDLAKCSPELITNQQAESLEDAVTKYYCQQFYIHFGRAAQVAHRLFPVHR